MGMVSQVAGHTGNAPANATRYFPLNVIAGTGTGESTQTNVKQVMPTGGVIDRLYVQLTTAPGGSDTRTFTLVKNDVDTALTVTISAAGTTGADNSNTVSFNAGDQLSMKCVASATAANPGAQRWVMRITSTNNNEQPIFGVTFNSLAANVTRYLSPTGETSNGITTEAEAQAVIPTAGVISNLRIYAVANVVATTFTVYKNGSSTGLTCSFSNNASATDAVNTVSVSAGDRISIEANTTGASGAMRAKWGFKFAPTIDGESIGMNSSISTQNQNNTSYTSPGGNGGFNTTEASADILVKACVIKKLYTNCTGIASGQTYTTMLRKNAGNTSTTNVITGTATTGSDTSNNTTYAEHDTMTFRGVTSATTGTVRPSIGAVFDFSPQGGNRNLLLMGAGG